MEKSFIDADHWKGAQLLDDLTSNANEQKYLQIIESLKPTFGKDGDQFCYVYGELPNNCICGFGETPYRAMQNFCQNFYNEKAKS